MRKIVNYNVITAFRRGDFNADVMFQIHGGWQPYGTPFQWGEVLAQAMVKYEEKVNGEDLKDFNNAI